MSKKKKKKCKDSSVHSILLCSIAGYQIRATPALRIFVQTPAGTVAFPYVDYFQHLKFSGPVATVPEKVASKIKQALANLKKAKELSRRAELSEPPDDL